MKKLLLAGLMLLISSVPSMGFNWVKVLEKTKKSITTIEHKGYGIVCTGFASPQSHIVVTAAHCNGAGLTVEGEIPTRLFYDPQLDVMVMRVPSLQKPGIQLRDKDVVDGLEILSVGHAYGYPEIHSRSGIVASASTTASPAILDFLYGIHFRPMDKYMAADHVLIGGQSGGPIVDTDGRLVSIVSMDDGETGFSTRLEDLKKALSKYF